MRLPELKGFRGCLFLPVLLFLLFAGISHADTNVSGNITTDTTWTLANSPYIVTSGMQVMPGITLTIEPGVTVRFNTGTLLRIGGQFIAAGTANQMITFTSNEATPAGTDWGPIGFVEGAVGSTLDENGEYVSGSVIKYCQIEYGIGIDSNVGLYVGNNNIIDQGGISVNYYGTIVNNTINKGWGIMVSTSGSSTSKVLGNTIINCGLGIRSFDNYGTCNIAGNTIIQNLEWVWVEAGASMSIIVSGNRGVCNLDANTIKNTSEGGCYGIEISNYGVCSLKRNTLNGDIVRGITLSGDPSGVPPTITENNLLCSGEFTILNWSGKDTTATNNWWGTTNISEIEAKIYDYYDDITRGKVIYQPIAQSAFPTTGTAPTAAFIATPLSGNAPLTVSFTDQSTNSPYSWSWNFGDGETSTEQHSSHTYSAAGTYTVSLTATNAYGSDTETKTNYITVYAVNAPIADFTASPTSGNAPLMVQFTDHSTNTPTFWSWNFGDGGTSAAQNPSHTYTSAGTHNVSLTVSNVAGSNTATKNGYIAVSSSGTGTIAGVVTDAVTGIGIGGATVSVSPGNFHTTTISSTPFGQVGAYILSGLPGGACGVTVSATGYNTTTQTGVTVNAGAITTLNISLTPAQVETKISFSINPACGSVGSPITISAPSAVGGHFFKYFVNTVSYCGTTTPSWQLIQDWTTERSITYTPSQAGRDTFVVWITDDITESCPQLMGASYGVGEADCIDAVEVSLTPASSLVNEPVTIRAVGATNDLKYSFWVNETNYDCRNPVFQNWVLLKDWSSSNSYTYTPTEEKVYTFVVWTSKDPTNNPCYGMAGMTYKVSAYTGGGEGYWSFNEQSGSVAHDTSGYGNDGVIYGATRGTGICGNALVFDGVNDYVEIPDRSSLDMANGITIEAWIRTDEIPSSGVKTIASKDENGEFHVYQDGKITAWLKNSSDTIFNVFGRTVLSIGTWYHVAMTCEKDRNLKVYVNGNEDGSIPFAGNLMTNNDPFQIGQDQAYPGRFFKGTIDEVHIYNRALSQPEIQQIMACGTGKLTGLVKDGETGKGLENATVTVMPGNYSAVTEPNTVFSSGGKYEIGNIPVGTYQITATKSGYVSQSQGNVVISDDQTTTVILILTLQ